MTHHAKPKPPGTFKRPRGTGVTRPEAAVIPADRWGTCPMQDPTTGLYCGREVKHPGSHVAVSTRFRVLAEWASDDLADPDMVDVLTGRLAPGHVRAVVRFMREMASFRPLGGFIEQSNDEWTVTVRWRGGDAVPLVEAGHLARGAALGVTHAGPVEACAECGP
jgi:hypothetical protein